MPGVSFCAHFPKEPALAAKQTISGVDAEGAAQRIPPSPCNDSLPNKGRLFLYQDSPKEPAPATKQTISGFDAKGAAQRIPRDAFNEHGNPVPWRHLY